MTATSIYYGLQSIVLSFAAAVVAVHEHDAGLWVLAALTFLVKGIGIPYGTRHFLIERFALKRDVALSTGLSSSLIFGAFLTAFAFLAIRPGTVPSALVAQAVVPISTAVILLGGLCMVVRRHTIAQLIGWLIIENGVFLGAIAIVATFPFIVEAGVFLDLVAAVLIMIAFVSGLARQLAEACAPELRQLSEMIALALIIVVVLPLAPGARHRADPAGAAAGAVAAASGLGDVRRRVALAIDLSDGHRVHALSGFIYLDPLSGFFLATIALVVALASFGSAAYLRAEEQRGELQPAAGAAVLHLLRDLRVDDARLVRDRQPRAAVGADRGEHARELRARRSRGQGGVARGGVEVHHHQLVRRDDRARRHAVSVLRGGQPSRLADRASDLVVPVRPRAAG